MRTRAVSPPEKGVRLADAAKSQSEFHFDNIDGTLERVSGEFDRTLSLPVQIEPDGIKAEYRDGILALFLPRAERDKPRSIKIT
jgi:HSP20 family molecular chaperone IbpA